MIRQTFVFFCLCGFLAGIPMVYYYVAVARGLGRALAAGVDIPTGNRGIPIVLLFTDRYPPIRDQRLKFVFWLCVFFGCVFAGLFVGTAFGSNW
jgi:hypothetical protein